MIECGVDANSLSSVASSIASVALLWKTPALSGGIVAF
jgi:hypothetical protein